MPFRNDFEIVMAAVTTNGYALQFASQELRSNWEIVKAAVSGAGAGGCLQFASPELRSDAAIVLAAVSSDAYAAAYASASLCADRNFMLAVVSKAGLALEYATPELRADRTIVLRAVSTNPFALMYACDAYVSDPEVMQYLAGLLIFRVSLMSGRCCLIVTHNGDTLNTSKQSLIMLAGSKLGLTEENIRRAELLMGTDTVPESNASPSWTSGVEGHVIDLVLVTTAPSVGNM